MRRSRDLAKRIALGSVGGLTGTIALQVLFSANQKWLPRAAPPIRQHPGEFMVKKARESLPTAVRGCVPKAVENSAAQALGIGYGVAFGALYAVIRPKTVSLLLDGLALGTAAWAAGYLGWLPALGLMRPIWKQSPPQAIAPVAEHAVYGVATVTAYDWLQKKLAGTA